jgi:hypothetical protein
VTSWNIIIIVAIRVIIKLIDQPNKKNSPERGTTSVASRPTSVNFLIIVVTESKGAGMPTFAAVWLAVVLSLLPKRTFQNGPPFYR